MRSQIWRKMKKVWQFEEYNQWLRNLPKHTVLGFQSCTDPKIRTIEESRENLRCLASSSMIVKMDSVWGIMCASYLEEKQISHGRGKISDLICCKNGIYLPWKVRTKNTKSCVCGEALRLSVQWTLTRWQRTSTASADEDGPTPAWFWRRRSRGSEALPHRRRDYQRWR